ncbi:unnamed protein product [Ectocarpus sp. 8 AP-2014]|uniref:Soluble NSF Attachment Protein (SNAP) Receptor (SNARE), Vesicle-associated membrane protein n=1 Tax=Ectocarpus siliculosus TaxID=2880 RepID=D8LQ56_ECTSI|nr:Soluble NSF Attachment Protein (SNAP) Receptor (SNARE), Vesicle-associated membrane protein [Ectocarpus siliculosus]|eukprot:CBN77436.1 Soluble NSF Attachment Protein (SNAP) Receptor (SNARE), Vesicle-associated membrane protein [Ectocarpus siliculosus]
MSRRITFLGVIRFTDRVLVAGYSPSEADDSLIIKELMSNPDTFVEPRKRYSVEGRMFSIHFVADDSNRIYSCVTDKEYPARIAFTLLEEAQTKFLTKVGDKSLTAKEGGLSRTMKSSFSDLCIKYDDIRNVDRMAAVQDKVDVVKVTMQDNIQQMLANEERLDQISENAENLNEQAKVFQNRSSALRRQMRCKAIKMWLLLALVVIILLIIIIVPIALHAKNNSD